MSTRAAFTFRPRVFPLERVLDGGQLLSSLGQLPGAVLLDSAAGKPHNFTLMGFEPLTGVDLPGCFEDLAPFCASIVFEEGADPVPGPFQGGFIGALAYDLGVPGEELDLPREEGLRAPILGGLYTDFVVTDHSISKSFLILGHDPGDERPSVPERVAKVQELLAHPRIPTAPQPIGPLVRHTPAHIHEERIRIAQAEIAAGEYYQANLAHRLTRSMRADPIDLYLALRRWNPAPYMGYLGTETTTLLSSSPEMLLECSGGKLRSRPIKGTLPRGRTLAEDRIRAKELLASEKDRAELAMIVDLVRNDCSRVAEVGSVRVGPLPELESHASVLHLAADVSAQLAPGRTALDALRALFPGGSISGAPKLRSMEAIAALEGEGRGFFTGSLGFLDCAGNGLFNILIRSLVVRSKRVDGVLKSTQEVTFWVGGGITAASDPAAEERETRVKGARLAAALAGEAAPEEALGLPLHGGAGLARHPFC
ncbi:MAG TPA: anthranilate synthase component I family protein [Planctomycetes bacterium]|nr:anthranilate synthase component I family protein [Planctomycetota bacterium]HIL38733.1 anthranilate synthase component I family protein [Planctomycetota bacterium]